MASPRLRRLRRCLTALTLLGAGLWLAGDALWRMARTAIYVHESVEVTGTVLDVRQKPFESWADTLGKGNWSMPGDVSYQPIVRFTLPGGINAIRLDLEADNVDYRIGQEIAIISPPGQPGKAHINRWKFLWGASTLRLGAGCLLSLIGYGWWCRIRGKRPAAAQPAKPAATPRRQTQEDSPAKAPRRRKAESQPGTTTRRRKKAESADKAADATAAPRKPRRSRKKKAQEQSPELPF